MSQQPTGPRPNLDAPFPAVIPLPAVEPFDDAGGCALASDVVTAADLPGRFLIADLVPDSLERSDLGWRALYFHRHGTGRVRLEWDAAENRLHAELSWRGREIHAFWPGARFIDVLRVCAPALPTTWEADIARVVEPLGVRYIPHARPPRGLVCYPDGILLTLAVPIPISRLRAVLALHDDLSRSGACRAGIRAGCALIARAPVDEHGDVVYDADAIAAIARRYGVPATERVGLADPARLLTCAWSYVYIATVFLRDLEPFIDALERAGILAPHGSGDGAHAASCSPFDEAVLAPRLSGAFLGGIILHARPGSTLPHREINLLEGEHAGVILEGGSSEAANQLITRAEAHSECLLSEAQ